MRFFTRILVAMIVTVVLSTGLVGLFIYRGVRTTLRPVELDQARTHVQMLAQGLEDYVHGAKADVLAVSKFPPVQGIIEAEVGGVAHRRNQKSLKLWRKQLAAIFLANLETNPKYLQFRLIGKADGGREIVRVDRSGPNGSLRVVQGDQLQEKGERSYFKESINLRQGSVFVSPIELNREWDAVQTPHVPVLRLATPVHRADGTAFGIVIVNLDMRPAFRHLLANSRQGQEIYLVNSAGDYLVNPDSKHEFGFDLGKRIRIQDDFPQLAGALSAAGVTVRKIQGAAGRPRIAVGVPKILAGRSRVVVFEMIPDSELLAAIIPVRRLSILAGLLVVFCAAIAAVVISRSISKPMNQITKAVESFSRNGSLEALPVDSAGETGVLARAFKRLVRTVQEKATALQKENEAKSQTEGELKERIEKERLLSAVIESTGDAILTKTLDGVITGWNEAATQLYGYTPEEAIGQSVGMIIPAERKEELSRILDMVRRDEKIDHYETVRLRKNGSLIDVSLTVSPVKSTSGEIIGASAIGRDVTQRKRAEAMFRLAVNSSPSGMIMVDAEGSIQLANDESARMFGYDRGELVGRQIEELLPSSIRAQHMEHRRSFFSEPMARSMGAGRDLVGRRKDGSEFPVEIGLNPTETMTGLMVLAAIADITERKQAERVIEEHAQELRRSNAELEQFAYVASHDLQEPLRMVTSYTELLAERYRSQLDERADKYIGYIVDGSRRMKQLINDLLEFSRLNTKAKPFEATDCSLVVKQVLTGMQTAISESGAHVQYENLPTLYAEPAQISRLFQNLISNAIKFRSEQVPEIRISAERSGGMWIFAVKDNGIGIDEAFSDRIFQMFQRLHGRSEYEGNGIGLTLAKKIVERHGGQIWFKSPPSGGTVFYFTLPLGDRNYDRNESGPGFIGGRQSGRRRPG